MMNLQDQLRMIETELTPEILDALIQMSIDWEAENSCYGFRRNELSDIEGNRIFIAEKDGVPIGYLFGHVEEAQRSSSVIADGTPYFEVEELYVKPAYRSQGVGKQLFTFAEKTVSKEVSFLMLSTATKNYKAILHFYLDEVGMEFWNARLFKKI